MQLRRGQRLPLTALTPLLIAKPFRISLTIAGMASDVDYACFGLDAQGKLSDERYMVFYNQPESPCNAIKIGQSNNGSVAFDCYLADLPTSIERLVFTAVLNGTAVMGQIHDSYLRLAVDGEDAGCFAFSGADFQDEKAVMLGEIYRKTDDWRFCAIGQGFAGGLAALVQHFGGEIADEPVQAPLVLSLEKKIAGVAPKLVDLAKKVTVSLVKHRLAATVARIGLVLDASGSMRAQYGQGKVQQLIDRLLPLAVHFDDDGVLDVWAFSHKPIILPPATLQNYADYIVSAQNGWRHWGMMGANNEPAVIEQVIRYYKSTDLPVFIIFISDGGVSQNAAIKKLLVDAASLPLFWQFVGIGGRNYGVLEKLDTLSGRIVDNCGFFALDDIDSISEQALYDRLLSEFPLWLEAAKFRHII